LTVWTLALSVLALSQPRRPLRRIARQPGVLACWAASLALATAVLLEVLPWLRRGGSELDFMVRVLPSAFRPMGCAVVAVWVIEAVSGRLRPEPSCLDRLGRLFGMMWIIAMLIPPWYGW
jgi:hypothetical protein